MRGKKRLRRTVWGGLILFCLCILVLRYFRLAQKPALIKALIPFFYEGTKEEEGEGEKVPPGEGSIPANDLIIGAGLALPMEGGVTLDPVSAVWDQVAGIEEALLPRQLDGLDVIVLEKGDGCDNAQIIMEELPTTRQLRLTISGISGNVLSDEQVKRIAGDTYYCGTPPTPTPTPLPTPTPAKNAAPTPTLAGTPTPTPTLSPDDPYYVWRNDVVKGIETVLETAPDQSVTQTLLLTLNKTYVYRLYEDPWNYYIELVRPKDVYNKIIVVDAGHGGVDEGTLAAGKEHMEKDINLDIVLRLKELFDAQDGITVYYTRTTDWKPSLQQRVDLANDLEADFFLSVHCNSNPVASLSGTEVLYDSRQDGQEGMTSGRFAQILSEEMEEHVGLINRGLVPRQHNLTIVKYAQVPVALVEVGFLSNASDTRLLIQEETRQKAAQALYEAILRGYEEMNVKGAEGW